MSHEHLHEIGKFVCFVRTLPHIVHIFVIDKALFVHVNKCDKHRSSHETAMYQDYRSSAELPSMSALSMT